MKRYRKRPTKPGRLEAYYGRGDDGEIDVILARGAGLEKRDSALLYYLLGTPRYTLNGGREKSVIDQLKDRGFDITTLRFSIEKPATAPVANPGTEGTDQ